jgi:hypothetical protein
MKKSNFTLIILFLLITSCQPKKPVAVKEVPVDTQAARPPAVQLTDAQKAEGWVVLFDGQTLDGWRTFKSKENASWEVKDGFLHCKPFDDRKIKEQSDIHTNNEYENFELSLEWKVAPQSNTGVIYRCTEEFNEPYLSGPEYQIIDDVGYPGELKETNKAGGTYDMYVAKNKTLKAVGEWNTTKIVVNGNHVEHWLNGSIVLEYELGAAEWKKKKSGSKWNDAKGYGAAKKGYIDLQDHGNEAWFRNILIRVL